MTPRTDTYMLDINLSLSDYLDELLNKKHSRIPVYDGEIDNIIGVLFIKDFILETRKKGFENVDIRSILRAPYFILNFQEDSHLFRWEMNWKKI